MTTRTTTATKNEMARNTPAKAGRTEAIAILKDHRDVEKLAAVSHAYDAGKGVVERIGSIAGSPDRTDRSRVRTGLPRNAVGL